jgi:hypothetical protein
MRFRLSEVQPTPNPNALKFILTAPVSESPVSFLSADAARENDLASKLFAVSGVRGLLFLGDFITVNKYPAARWVELRALIEAVLREDSASNNT